MKQLGENGTVSTIEMADHNVSQSNKGWINHDVTAIKYVHVSVNSVISKAMMGLYTEFPDVEFSIFGISKWVEKEKIVVMEDEFYIPNQKVTTASVDYDHNDCPEKYNTVIHKHPDGCMSFSGTDEEFINANFDYTLLWVNRKFHIGLARASTKFGYIHIPVRFIGSTDMMFDVPHDYHKIKRVGGKVRHLNVRQTRIESSDSLFRRI